VYLSCFSLPRLLSWYLGGMLTTHAIGSATVSPIVYCSFIFRVVDFITDDLKIKIKKLL